MVLGDTYVKWAVICTLIMTGIGTVLVAKQLDEDSGAIRVKNYELRLDVEQDKCRLVYVGLKAKGQLALLISPPCEFIRYQGSPLSYTYKDLDKATVLLVVGGPLDSQKTDPLMPAGCGTQVQAILLRQNSVSASQSVGRGGTFCPSAGADEKMFWFFGHH